MAGGTKFDVDDRSVVRVLEGLRSVLRAGTSRETLSRVGDAAIAIIKERTQAKKRDSMEGPFVPYRPGYAAQKGVAPSQVDLTLTQQMFNSLARRPEGAASVRLFFSNAIADAKAVKHHFGLEGMPERPFMAIGEVRAEVIILENLVQLVTQMRINALMGVFQ
jgi:hypothetical protein